MFSRDIFHIYRILVGTLKFFAKNKRKEYQLRRCIFRTTFCLCIHLKDFIKKLKNAARLSTTFFFSHTHKKEKIKQFEKNNRTSLFKDEIRRLFYISRLPHMWRKIKTSWANLNFKVCWFLCSHIQFLGLYATYNSFSLQIINLLNIKSKFISKIYIKNESKV